MTSLALTLTLALNAVQPQPATLPPMTLATMQQHHAAAELQKYRDRNSIGLIMIVAGGLSVLSGLGTGFYVLHREIGDAFCNLGDALGGDESCPQHNYTR